MVRPSALPTPHREAEGSVTFRPTLAGVVGEQEIPSGSALHCPL